jgi:hypothetical protein
VLQLRLTGEFDGHYLLQTAESLDANPIAWQPWRTVTNTHGTLQLNDTIPANGVQRFYRAVEAP